MLKQKTRVLIDSHTDGIVMSLPIIFLCRKESCLKMHLMLMCSYNTQHKSPSRGQRPQFHIIGIVPYDILFYIYFIHLCLCYLISWRWETFLVFIYPTLMFCTTSNGVFRVFFIKWNSILRTITQKEIPLTGRSSNRTDRFIIIQNSQCILNRTHS